MTTAPILLSRIDITPGNTIPGRGDHPDEEIPINHSSRKPGTASADIALDHVQDLYRTYEADLRRVRDEQRALRRGNPTLRAQLDDLEAEITYLLVRDSRPEVVVEIGSLHGWSTNWLLRALRDNGAGRLYTHDLVDDARRHVSPELGSRWTFVPGDARRTLHRHGYAIDYLFVDARHTAGFARWFVGELFPTVRPGVPVSVHDVFHGRRPWPFSEGRVVLSWLARRNTAYFTASRAAAPQANAALAARKDALGLSEPVHDGRDDPMMFFRMP